MSDKKHDVFVLDINEKPLTPTNFRKAKKLIKGKVAKKVWSKFGTFGIQLLVETRTEKPDTVLGIDNGTKFEGYSIVCDIENNLNIKLDLPDKKKIVRKLEERRILRRTRRQQKCRRREARFNNRKRDGFIAPSQLVIVNSRLKVIKELIKIWQAVMRERPDAKLAIIGSGDSEEEDIRTWAALRPNNVKWFGYMGEERFDVYRQSKMVLYPTPYNYGHFSIGPVEAMACGCPMVAFNLDVMKIEKPVGAYLAEDIDEFYKRVLWLLKNDTVRYAFSQCAIDYARAWDWSVRAPKILKEIKEKL